MLGISIKENIGIGDKVQFSSVPENYFCATGKLLVDVSRCWIFDHNPYVARDVIPESVQELWNFGPKQFPWPAPRAGVYKSNAEIWAMVMKLDKVTLNRPRLYRFENYPFHQREMILFQTHGRSHGTLPDHVIDHVIKKYKPTRNLFHIGLPSDPDLGIPKIKTNSLWELAEVISKARMHIGIDSGPAWIAACYPDVIVKKIRCRRIHGEVAYSEWVPLEAANIHSHWDDRLFNTYCVQDEDVGFMQSYRKL